MTEDKIKIESMFLGTIITCLTLSFFHYISFNDLTLEKYQTFYKMYFFMAMNFSVLLLIFRGKRNG